MSDFLEVMEKVLNVILGLSFYSWALFGFYFSEPEERFSIVRIAIIIIHLVIGTFIILRRKIVKESSLKHILMSLPSIINSGIAFKITKALHIWPWYAQGTFLAGAFITLVSFSFLRRNFCILPGLRSICTNGPYRIIRHPGYVGEFIIVIGCALSTMSYKAFITIVLAIPFLIMRIHAEESVLSASREFITYKNKVNFRLLPGIW